MPEHDTNYINAMLLASLEALVRSLYPHVHISIKPHEIRLGSYGSLVVCRKTGRWYCFEQGRGGDLIELIRYATGFGFIEAVRYAEQSHNNAAPRLVPQHTAKQPVPNHNRKWALQIWQQSQPIGAGDPVALYLMRRGISLPYPADIRVHPSLRHPINKLLHPAMIAAFRDMTGDICGIHRTYLTPDGRKAGA